MRRETGGVRTVLVVYDGVLDDECEAFRSVLGLLSGDRVVAAGAERRPYRGPGGTQHPDVTFDEVETADVVVVPGGIGCERATDDSALQHFLRRMEHHARYLALLLDPWVSFGLGGRVGGCRGRGGRGR